MFDAVPMIRWTRIQWDQHLADLKTKRPAYLEWKPNPPSDAQRRALDNFYVPPDITAQLTKYEAYQIIGRRVEEATAWNKQREERAAKNPFKPATFNVPDLPELPTQAEPAKLLIGSPKQLQWAEKIRAQILPGLQGLDQRIRLRALLRPEINLARLTAAAIAESDCAFWIAVHTGKWDARRTLEDQARRLSINVESVAWNLLNDSKKSQSEAA